jgi:hypothetical protein
MVSSNLLSLDTTYQHSLTSMVLLAGYSLRGGDLAERKHRHDSRHGKVVRQAHGQRPDNSHNQTNKWWTQNRIPLGVVVTDSVEMFRADILRSCVKNNELRTQREQDIVHQLRQKFNVGQEKGEKELAQSLMSAVAELPTEEGARKALSDTAAVTPRSLRGFCGSAARRHRSPLSTIVLLLLGLTGAVNGWLIPPVARYATTICATWGQKKLLPDWIYEDPLVGKAVSVMRQLCHITEPNSFTPVNTGFIVRQGIPYEAADRFDSAERIVRYMETRQELRLENPRAAMDKMINPLIVVLNGPGVGKSTFLVHLIEHPAYQQYCKGVPAIIAPLTFNSGMCTAPVALGLRVLFGAATAMGRFKDVDMSWNCFAETLGALDGDLFHLSASSAVEALHQLYGPERRVLILVDELAAAAVVEEGGDEAVMRQLLGVIGKHGSADVVISALRAPYIDDLVWKFSTRSTIYEPLGPLYHLESGRKACAEWAGKVLGGRSVTDKSVRTLLERAVRLVSGHGRSLERLLEAFVAHGGSFDPSQFPDHKLSTFANALSWLVTEIAQVCGVEQPPNQCVEEYVLQTCSVSVDKQRELRRELQDGTLVIQRGYPGFANGECYLGVRLATLLIPVVGAGTAYPNQELRKYPRLRMLVELLGGGKRLSHLWERCLDLTILVHSADRTDLEHDVELSEVFGARGLSGHRISAAVSGNQQPSAGVYSLNLNLNLIVPLKQAGYDSKFDVTTTTGRRLTIAIHAKLDRSANMSDAAYLSKMSGIYGTAVVNTLVELLPQREAQQEVSDLHVIFYNYGAKNGTLDWAAIRAAASEHLRVMAGGFNVTEQPATTATGVESPVEALTRGHEVAECSRSLTGRKATQAGAEAPEETTVALGRDSEGSVLEPAVAADVRAFLEHCLHHNVHLVPQPQMDEWLIPSFVDLPNLAADVWEEDPRYGVEVI